LRFAVDTGGTFTDLIVEEDSGGLRMYKASTTPENPVRGVRAAIDAASADLEIETRTLLGRADLLVHGTTIATNAILTRNTARTAFLTTRGHRDILVIREGGRIGLSTFDYAIPYPEPYVPRALTFEVPERIGMDGTVVAPLDEDAVIESLLEIERHSVEAVGVCLLWSIVNPVHEKRIGELLETHLPGVPYSLSHEINPSLREYRRASSTCIDVSLKPLLSRYLNDLRDELRESGFRGRLLVITSQSGVLDASDVAQAPIHSIKSGPAMAPVAGRHYASVESRSQTAIVADAGGTTYDVSLIRKGQIPWTRETWIGRPYLGHMTGFPSVDVTSVGAGGGSIAWVDTGGLLHVGPDSAGSVPGPACYGRGGTRPTVTDAAVTLGYIDPARFLNGTMDLDVAGARSAMGEHVGGPLAIGLDQAAVAVIDLLTENMVTAIEEITIHQGIDPRYAVLVGGGGAAGLNIIATARRLGCKEIVIPDVAAGLSAAGALISDLTSEYAELLFTTTTGFDRDRANRTLGNLERRCQCFIDGPGARSFDQSIEFFVEGRYLHQIWEIDVPLRQGRFDSQQDVDALTEDFHRVHEQIFAFSDPDSEIELVSWHARVRCQLRESAVGSMERTRHNAGFDHGTRECHFGGFGMLETDIVWFEAMQPDEAVTGPAIVESPFTTVVVDPGAEIRRTLQGNLVIIP